MYTPLTSTILATFTDLSIGWCTVRAKQTLLALISTDQNELGCGAEAVQAEHPNAVYE